MTDRKTPRREYRNEYGDVTTDPKVADGWSDAALETDCRDGDGDWRPFNYEGTEAVTADRIAYYAAANDLDEIDRNTLDAQDRITLTGAANDVRDAELALAGLIDERPARTAA